MPKTTLMFGSIGAVVETSDIQRRAYNTAMQEAGLNWHWEPEIYADLLRQAGGKERLAHLAAATGTALSQDQIDQIHARKTEIAATEVAARRVALRPGVMDLVELAKARGMKLSFVTTTFKPNIEAIFKATGNTLSADSFDVIITRDDVQRGKPAPDAYKRALAMLGVSPQHAVAIEDTANSVMAAKRAGIAVIATPGELTADQDLWQADLVLSSLATGSGVDRRVLEMLD
ncbi:HAD-IA family hydrolase [Lichenicoccus sp.]|uniref:HAD-IA family hydrolase n=1 Tax=Lichenicoccus sp. TaxID=2781899 RepID=UPI003D13FD86